MDTSETELWAEYRRLHLQSVVDWQDGDCIYVLHLRDKISELEMDVLKMLRDYAEDEQSRSSLLHGYRRLMAIMHQEEELLGLDDMQARAIGEDRAFVALGRG